ncbi:MAG: flap endonuclease [Streptosporangiales bacterium]|nr:flap endonuclease [Streptosporangiales bacterium]
MLLDSASMYFRAFYGVPEKITAPDGTPVNAVRGFLDNIAYLVRTRGPAGLVACMDASWRPEFRVALLPSYKAHRAKWNGDEDVPATLLPQVPVIEECLDALGIPRIGVHGYEADDVIGTLAARATTLVEVVSGDRDLFQVVDDDRQVRVLYIGRGVLKLQVVDDEWLRQKYDVSGATYADFACLRGDPSDGLPGVSGVGERTAADLIRKYGDLAAMLAAADAGSLPKGTATKLAAARDYLAVAPQVVQVATDAPVPDHDPALPAEPADPQRLVKLGERWGLDSPLNRVLTALGHR